MKYTAAPWENSGYLVTDDNGVIIADCRIRIPKFSFEPWKSNENRSVEELRANARLIAAAPRMFEALKAFEHAITHGEIQAQFVGQMLLGDAIEKATAAMAEATGAELAKELER